MQVMGTTGTEEYVEAQTIRNKAARVILDTLVVMTGRMPPYGACEEIVSLIIEAAKDEMATSADKILADPEIPAPVKEVVKAAKGAKQ